MDTQDSSHKLQRPIVAVTSCTISLRLQIVHRQKIYAAIVAVLMIGAAAASLAPRAHAFQSTSSLNSSGYAVRDYYDSYLGTYVDGVHAGNTLTFTVTILADSNVYQRNISMGIKFDWMSAFQNATNANPSQTYPLTANQIAYLSVTVNIPQLSGQYSNFNQQVHYYTLEIWSTPQNQPSYTGYCPTDYANYGYYYYKTGCLMYSDYSYYNNCNYECTVSGHPLAIYSDAQNSVASTSQQAAAEIGALQTYFGSLTTPPPGSSAAAADLAAAIVQENLGQNAYRNGDFGTAQTDYQNALNDANAAQSSLATTGGGTDIATMTSIWLGAAAVLMGGIGAVLLGFGGFKYMRGKTRAISGNYTPSPSSPKPN